MIPILKHVFIKNICVCIYKMIYHQGYVLKCYYDRNFKEPKCLTIDYWLNSQIVLWYNTYSH